MKEPTRRRRDSRTPLPGREHPIEHPTERDKRIFTLLDPFYEFKFLTSAWIHFFEPADRIYNSQRLGWLYAAPNYFLDRDEEQRHAQNADYKHSVYSIATAGRKALAKAGYVWHPAPHRSNSYAHEFLVDMGWYAPMRFAADADPELTITLARDFTKRPAMPAATAQSDDPFVWKLRDGTKQRFDGAPFILHRNGRSIASPGIQADRGTETNGNELIERAREARKPIYFANSALGRHIAHIVEYHETKAFERQYGFKNEGDESVMYPIVCTTQGRAQNAMIFLESIRPRCGYIVFYVIPDLAYERHFPKPSADFFTQPGRRVGFPDFSLATMEAVS